MARRAKPAAEMVITDVEALKVISDPLRLKIVEHASLDAPNAFTAKQMAAKLGTSQTKLYHHLNLLEEHGFLRVAETRTVSGILERHYVATAHAYRVDRSVLGASGGESTVTTVIDAMFDEARRDILAAIRAGLVDLEGQAEGQEAMALSMTRARLSKASVAKVMRQIRRLSAIDRTEDPDGDEFGLLVGFYPRTDEGAGE